MQIKQKICPDLFAAAVGLIPRLIIIAAAVFLLGASVQEIFFSHDGKEYYIFAEKIASNDLRTLPVDTLRHDPGLPLLIAGGHLLSFKLVPLAVVAGILVPAASWLMIFFGRKVYDEFYPDTTSAKRFWFSVALLAGIPAWIYYGCINLTESTFTAALLAALYFLNKSRLTPAFLAAGVAILIRTTGIFMLLALNAALFIEDLRQRKPFFRLIKKHAILNALALAPWAAWQAVSLCYAESTSITSHKPVIGLPFSGFVQTPDISTVRAVYIWASVALVLLSVIMLCRQALLQKGGNILLNALAIFSGTFVLFHICLKTLYYIDKTVYTFNYQDRYFIPLWIITLLMFQRWINRYTILAAMTAGTAIALYWTKNYIAAAGL